MTSAATDPNAIILHGRPSREEFYDPDTPSPSNHHWLPWLAKQLMVRDIAAVTPELPHPYLPRYPAWRREFERFEIGPHTRLVGHSCGAAFLVRWLSEHPGVQVDRVVLVAPWLDPDQETALEFFDFTIDPALASRAGRLVVFDSDNDVDTVRRSAQLLRDTAPGTGYRRFTGYGHFTIGDIGPTFPELLDALVT